LENYQIVWAPRAINELTAIRDYIAAESPRRAQRLAIAIHERAAQLSHFPYSGARFKRTRVGQYRQISYRKYRIFYRVERLTKTVYIVAIWHGARREPRLL
jgi:plasmid stabilization system protein ParE